MRKADDLKLLGLTWFREREKEKKLDSQKSMTSSHLCQVPNALPIESEPLGKQNKNMILEQKNEYNTS